MQRTKLYSRGVLVLGAVQLIESIAFALPMSYFPNYVIGLGASVASLGLFISSFMVSSAIMSPRIGALSDREGRKKIMVFGLIGDVVFGTLTGLVPSWHWLLLVRVIDGAVSSAAMLSAEALLIDTVPPTQRGEASGFVMAMGMVGRNIGPVFGGVIQWYSLSIGLSVLNSYRIPYFIDSVLASAALVLVVLLIHEPKVEGRQREMRLEAARNAAKVPLSTSFKVLLIYSFINGLGVGFIMPISVLFYNDKFGIDPLQIGTIISISGFVGLFASWLAGRVSDRAGRKPIIAAGNVRRDPGGRRHERPEPRVQREHARATGPEGRHNPSRGEGEVLRDVHDGLDRRGHPWPHNGLLPLRSVQVQQLRRGRVHPTGIWYPLLRERGPRPRGDLLPDGVRGGAEDP